MRDYAKYIVFNVTLYAYVDVLNYVYLYKKFSFSRETARRLMLSLHMSLSCTVSDMLPSSVRACLRPRLQQYS